MKKTSKTVVATSLIFAAISLPLLLGLLFDWPFLNGSYLYYTLFAYSFFVFIFLLLRETLKIKLPVSVFIGTPISLVVFGIVAVLKVEHYVMELLLFAIIISTGVLILRNAMKEWNEKNL